MTKKFCILMVILILGCFNGSMALAAAGIPEATIISPSNNILTSPAGNWIDFDIAASDDSAVTKVELYCDGALSGTALPKAGETGIYNYKWKTLFGSHTFKAKAYDAAGNVGTSSSVTINVPTNVTITSPADGTMVNGIIQQFKATAQEPVKEAYLFIDGVYTGASIKPQGTDIQIPYEWDTSKVTEDGTHSITIVCFTSAGNIVSVGNSRVSTDSKPPVTGITLEGDYNDSGWFTSNVKAILTAVDYPNPGGSGVASTVYGFEETNFIDYSQPFILSDEGVMEVVYRSTDNAGNIEPLNRITVKIDKTKPTINITLPVDDSFADPDTTLKITAKATDNNQVVKVEFYTGNGQLLGEGTPENAGGTDASNYFYNWNAIDGVHFIKAKAYDAAGNFTFSNTIKIKVLKVVINSPAENSAVSGTITSFQAATNVPVQRADLYIEGQLKTSLTGLNTTSINITFAWDTRLHAENSHPEIEIRCYTVSGNVPFSGKVKVTVDNDKAPTVRITNPTNNSVVGSNVSFRIEAGDDIGVSNVSLYCDGTYIGAAQYREDEYWGCDHWWDIYWAFDWVTVEGTHTFVAKAADTAGNVGSSPPVTLIVPPAVKITSPLNGARVDGIVSNFQATTRDVLAAADLYIDGARVSTVSGNGTTTIKIPYNWDTYFYPDGSSHTIEILKGYNYRGTTTVIVDHAVKMNLATDTIVSGIVNSFSATVAESVYSANLYIDGTKMSGITNITPTGVEILYNWNTAQYTDGSSHIIEIKCITTNGVEIIGKSKVIVDSLPPQVTIQSPSDNAIISPAGYTVDLQAVVSDTSLSKVELYLDGNLLGEPYYSAGDEFNGSMYWYPWKTVVGTHTILFKAYDKFGKVGTASITVKVPTTVTVINPVNGSTVEGVVNNFSATTKEPVTKAELYIDGVYKNASVNYPSGTTTVSIPFNWDTNQYNVGGNHEIEIRCYTAAGNVQSVGKINVTVGTVVRITNPIGSSVSGIISNFTATSNNPIQRADLYIDQIKKGSVESINSTSINIPFSWDTTQLADYSSHVVEIRAYKSDGKEIIAKSTVYVDNSFSGG